MSQILKDEFIYKYRLIRMTNAVRKLDEFTIK